METTEYDAIIVGAGATGGWAAKHLTENGFHTLLLDAGPSLDLTEVYGKLVAKVLSDESFGDSTVLEFLTGEKKQPSPRQPIQSTCYAYHEFTRDLFVDDLDHPYRAAEDQPFTWIRQRLVGGRTTLWQRVVHRMTDREFQAASRDEFGTDWPITYSDLKPYYELVEDYMGVEGNSDHSPEVPDGVFRPARDMTPNELQFKKIVEEKWPERRVILARGASLVRPGSSIMAPDAVPFFNSAGSTIPAALKTGLLVLRPNSAVSRVLTDEAGEQATGVEYRQAGSEQIQQARGQLVILCASALESTRILLNSESRGHSQGLANSSGVLGRYLMDHTFGIALLGHGPEEPCPLPFVDTGIYIPNFRNVDETHPHFIRGYGIQGSIGFSFPSKNGPRSGFWLSCFGEMLGRPENRVTLNREVLDAWGFPTLNISCRFSENELEMARDQSLRLEEMVHAAGYTITHRRNVLSPPGAALHEMGTARMGSEPSSSVLTPFNQSWDIPNLFVTDGAAFVSSGFQNPTLTMMALTVRACDYIVKNFPGRHKTKAAPWKREEKVAAAVAAGELEREERLRGLARYGGRPEVEDPLPPVFPGAARLGRAEEEAVLEVLGSKRLFRHYGIQPGPSRVDQLEAAFAERLGVKHCLAVNSGTSALICALVGLDIGPGDEVILPAYAWLSCATAVLAVGAVPVLAEIDESLTLDPEDVRLRISPFTKAIMAVHMRGAPCQLDELQKIAAEHRVAILEDTAQSLGGSYRGEPLGSIGEVGIFSLQYNKIITCGDGGVVATSHHNLYERALSYHDFLAGVRKRIPPQRMLASLNLRMTELQAAVAQVQLGRLDPILEGTRENHSRLTSMLAPSIGECRFTPRRVWDPAGDTCIAWVVLLEDARQASEIVEALHAEGVGATQLFSPALPDGHVYTYWFPLLRRKGWSPQEKYPYWHQRVLSYRSDMCPKTLDILGRSVHLDISPDFSVRQVEQVAAALDKVFRAYAGPASIR